MSTPSTPATILEEMNRALERCHGNRAAAARDLGLPPSTFKSRLNRAHERAVVDGTEDLPMTDRRRFEDEVTRLRSELRDMARQQNDADDIRKLAFGLAEFNPSPPKWSFTPSSSKRQQEMPILFTSDFQFGEVVSLAEMDGVNEYNPKIAENRYKVLIQRTIDICFSHSTNTNYPGIYYLRGGDAISGAIHQELAETDAFTPPVAVMRLAEIEIAGIKALKEKFGKVHVISIPGNHGRTTLKPRAKQYADLNLESLLAWAVELYFRDDPDVTFSTPRSGDAHFTIFNTRFLLTHGDRIGSRGGTGFVGPAATILRGFKKTKQVYDDLGKSFDYLLVGHYHSMFDLGGCFANGSLIGYNEYAMAIRAKPEPPQQWLLFVHPEKGVVRSWKVWV